MAVLDVPEAGDDGLVHGFGFGEAGALLDLLSEGGRGEVECVGAEVVTLDVVVE